MYGSPPLPTSNDLNLPHQSTGPYSGGRAEEAESDLRRRCRQQQQMSSSLLRYRSAPSTLLGEICEDFVPVRSSGLETDTMLARFLAPDIHVDSPGGATATVGHSSPRFPPPPPSTSAQESCEQRNRAYTSAPQMVFCPPQQMPSQSSAESAFRTAIGSSAMETEQIKNGGDFGSSCSLIRHSSSPAGLFSHLNVENGYDMMRGIGGFRNGSGFVMDAASRSKGQQISFFSRQNSIMLQISETGSEDMDGSSSPGDGGGRSYITGFPVASWDDSSPFDSSSFSGGPKRSSSRREDEKMVAGLESLDPQNGETKNRASGLPHQLSLPKTSSEITTIEKFLQFHDAVPCKIRAKRGCATHPRSIAERVRRTRISERIKKLQEIVPNMDKQTNTADMLDLAVDYIKDLQKQVKALSESRASCSCSASSQKQF